MTPRMQERWFTVILTLALLAVAPWRASVSAASHGTKSTIAGMALCRERVALTPTALFEATLEDVSRADAPAHVIARVRKQNPGQIPITFKLSFDPRRIDARKKYVVRASIYEHGQLRFTGSQAHAMQAHSRSNKVSVLMRPPSGNVPASLGKQRWRPIRIGGRAAVVAGLGRELWMELDPSTKRVTGSEGCNRFSGSYEAGNGTLRFGPLMSTKMACSLLETETALFRALADTRRYRVRGRNLELLDDRGRVLAQLEEENP